MQEPTIFACPVCGAQLYRAQAEFGCAEGHRYDRARQGYVNLLPQGRRRESGDSPQMLQARRRIFEAGYYAPIADAVTGRWDGPAQPRILDVGCGEGYYLRRLDAALGGRCYGMDIAKAAAAMASRSHPHGTYAVANSYRIPVLESQVDLAVKVFAPADSSELARVLAPAGVVVEVIPRPAHMEQLRRLIYRTDRPHDDAFSAAAPGTLRIRSVTAVRADLELAGPQLLDLLDMTPYGHHADEGVRRQLAGSAGMTVTLDCEVRVLTRG